MEDIKLKEAAINLARHIHNSKFDSIIFSGGSSPVSKTLLYSAWRAEYPEEKVPRSLTISSDGNMLFYKKIEPIEATERQALAKEWINQNMPELWNLKDKKVCLIDELAVSGEKVQKLSELFESLGFKNLETAIFAASPNAELNEKTFVASQNYELLTRLWSAASRIQKQPFIDDSELPEGEEKEIYRRGIEDLRGMVGEIRK